MPISLSLYIYIYTYIEQTFMYFMRIQTDQDTYLRKCIYKCMYVCIYIYILFRMDTDLTTISLFLSTYLAI